MELREGSNRQIRQLMADLGHPVKRMRRTRMGPVRLRGLAVGAWRDLTHSELSQLRQEAFADVATIQKRRASPSKNVTKSVGRICEQLRAGVRLHKELQPRIPMVDRFEATALVADRHHDRLTNSS